MTELFNPYPDSDASVSYDYRFRVKGDATGDTRVVLGDYSA